MSLKGDLERHDIVSGPTPTEALEQTKKGKLVTPPFGGLFAGVPPWLDPMNFTVFTDDFYWINEDVSGKGGWEQKDIGSGLSAGPLTSGGFSLNGELDVATHADDAAGSIFQWETAGFVNLAVDRPYWFSMRAYWGLASIALPMRLGVAATTADPFAADANGVYFNLSETSGKTGTIVKNAGGTTETADHSDDNVGETWHEFGFHYDGVDSIQFYKDRAKLGDPVTTNIPVGLSLEPFFAVKNNVAGAKIAAWDFIHIISTRPANA